MTPMADWSTPRSCREPELDVMGTKIVFETHSLTEDNEAGLATGWLSGRLSATGREYAVALGSGRRADGLAAVFSSDLGRAVETAAIAFAHSDIRQPSEKPVRPPRGCPRGPWSHFHSSDFHSSQVRGPSSGQGKEHSTS